MLYKCRLCQYSYSLTRSRAHFGVRLSFLWSPEYMPQGPGFSSALLQSPSSSDAVALPSGAEPGRLCGSAISSLSVSRLSTSISNSQPPLSDMFARVFHRRGHGTDRSLSFAYSRPKGIDFGGLTFKATTNTKTPQHLRSALSSSAPLCSTHTLFCEKTFT